MKPRRSTSTAGPPSAPGDGGPNGDRASRTSSRARPPSRGRRGARSTGDAAGCRRIWPFLGPAFVAAVAYIDPGNFATNIAGGAKFGYLLLWVVLAANLIAMVVQTQSAKLGIATGKNLAEVCREMFSRRTSIGLWIQAEIVAMATDIAEVVGAALGLNLLFGIPLFPAGAARRRRRLRDPRPCSRGASAGSRPGSRCWSASSSLAFAFEIFNANPDGGEVAKHLFVPGFAGTESILLATGIIGATVMPHVIYLHSALTQRRIVGRNDEERRKILRFEKIDVVIAMALAGVVNLSMMIMAAALFHDSGLADIDTHRGRLSTASSSSSRGNAATIFGIALLASGLRLLLGRDDGRPGRDAGLHPAPDPDLRCAARSPWRRRCSCSAIGLDPTDALVDQPGRALVRHPVRAGAAADDRPPAGPDGVAGQPALADRLAGVLAAMIIALNVFLLQQVFFG